MPLGMEVSLGLRDIVLDGDPAPPALKGHSPPIFGQCALWPNGWMIKRHHETGYKLCKFYENRARGTPLRGLYIPHFDQISVIISVLWVLYPNRCTDGGEIWHG